MNSNEIIVGLKALDDFTSKLADETIKRRASFADGDRTRPEHIQQAAASAKRFAEQRNKNLSTRTLPFDDSDDLVKSVTNWSRTVGNKLRGGVKK